jgi:cysteine desulfuration protein SufE
MSLTEKAQIVEDLTNIDDQNEKYRYLVNLGREVDDYPEAFRSDDFKIKGCISQLWLHPKLEGGKVFFSVDSDASIPKGIAALLARVYSGCTPDEVLGIDPAFLIEIGVEQALSMNRRNGLSNLIKQIRLYGMAYRAASQA